MAIYRNAILNKQRNDYI